MNPKDKKSALSVMIGIGTKKGLGMKESNEDYKDSSMEEEDMKEDSSEMNVCEKCDHEMVCSGCNKPESECTC